MIKYLIMDVDGTLTDGKIYIGNNGECMKAFSVKDGYVIHYILKPNQITPVVITARTSHIVQKRCQELGIQEVHQGKLEKFPELLEIVGKDNLAYCAYFGDDILDLACMIPIKEAGGVVGCPADSVKEVKEVAHYICANKAGDGALREFTEWLVRDTAPPLELENRIHFALDHLSSLNAKELQRDEHEVNAFFSYTVHEYHTKEKAFCALESHRDAVVIQYILQGEEVGYIASTAELEAKTEDDRAPNTMHWKHLPEMVQVKLKEQDYVVLYPKMAYMGGVQVKTPNHVKKLVGKIKLI